MGTDSGGYKKRVWNSWCEVENDGGALKESQRYQGVCAWGGITDTARYTCTYTYKDTDENCERVKEKGAGGRED